MCRKKLGKKKVVQAKIWKKLGGKKTTCQILTESRNFLFRSPKLLNFYNNNKTELHLLELHDKKSQKASKLKSAILGQ